jgi:hypothetical protein
VRIVNSYWLARHFLGSETLSSLTAGLKIGHDPPWTAIPGGRNGSRREEEAEQNAENDSAIVARVPGYERQL